MNDWTRPVSKRTERIHVMLVRTAIPLLLLCLGSTPATAQQVVATFALRDFLKRDWQNELVMFPVSKDVFERDDLALIGPDEKPVTHQWAAADLATSERDSIAFLASVAEFGTSEYRLIRGNPARTTDLRIREGNESVTLENALTGVRIGGREALSNGPIAGIRLKSGRWVGGGQLDSPLVPKSCKTTVLSRGPVFADVLVSYEFPKFGFWRLRFRMIAGQPVVLVDEEFDMPEGSAYLLDLAKGFSPDELFYRDNQNTCRLVKTSSVAGETAFLLNPWPTWWNTIPEAHWAGFCRSDDLLMIGAREPSVWVEPDRTEWQTTIPFRKTDLVARFQLRGYRRQWMLAALSKAESVPEKEARVAPLPQQHLIKHGDLPLDRVKDYVFEWDDRKTSRPGLFLNRDELDRFRKRFKVDSDQLDKLRTTQIFPYRMEDHVSYFLATGDKELGQDIAVKAMELAQGAVDGFVKQDGLRNQGSCPHHRTRAMMWSAILADLAMSPGVLTPEERTRLKAQLAFLGYTMYSPTFHSPERGYRANPNMTTTARGMLGLIACSIHGHPEARNWAQLAIDEMDRELDQWCGPNGGWLEAPHYMTVSMDAIVSLALALRNTGFGEADWQYHPKLKNTMVWLAKISTPPDPRLDGDRHMPAIGNTYLGERTCLSGWAAFLFRNKDAQYSQQMQWMWKAHGMPRTLGIGGAYPGIQGYEQVVLDESMSVRAPAWGSEMFPDAGAVFRSHFPSDRETYLHYIQGPMHEHYDYDEGSFILWGKGSPLCEDFGYYGRAPAADHSRVDDGFVEELGNEGRIREFASGDGADYLRGERAGWNRQILFVKDDDPLGPTYFLIRDSVLSGREADWRVWIATDDAPPITQKPIRAAGRFEADLAVFFAEPTDVRPSTSQITRQAGASSFASRESTQRCLQVKMPPDQPLAAVLYPVMKDQPTPKMTALADGRVVKIESKYGTDYAMLALQNFRFELDGIQFYGKAGAVQIRPKGVRLSLPRRGRLSYRGTTVENRDGSARTISRRVGR